MMISSNPFIQQALEAGNLASSNAGGVATTGTTKASESGEDFASVLKDALGEVNDAQNKASDIQDDFMTGRKKVDVHDVMIEAQKASTSLQLTMAVRNKALEAYQEINRMQI